MEAKLGFSPLKVDEVILAERFGDPGWSFAIVHIRDTFDLARLTKTLGLQKVKDAKVKLDSKANKEQKALNLEYYKVANNPWLATLGRLAPGVPPAIRQLIPVGKGPLFLQLRDSQTLILADEQPLVSCFRVRSRRPAKSRLQPRARMSL